MDSAAKQVLYFSFLAKLLTEKDLQDFFQKHLIIVNKEYGVSCHCYGFLSLESPEELYDIIKEHWVYSLKISTMNKLKEVAIA